MMGAKTLLTGILSLLLSAPFERFAMKTFLPTVDLDKRAWHVIDANGAVLGRLAARWPTSSAGRTNLFTPRTSTPAITEYENDHCDRHEHAAVNRPPRLATHEAARQDIDPLQEPYAPREQAKNGDDVDDDSHGSSLIAEARPSGGWYALRSSSQCVCRPLPRWTFA